MKIVLKVLMSAGLLAGALFCVFGFMATFEPMTWGSPLGLRIGYAVVGVALLAGIIALWRVGRR